MATIDTNTVKDMIAEMFTRVGRSFDRSFDYPEDWYLESEWTQEEEEDYRKWLIALLTKKYKQSKGYASKNASWFLFLYGWRIKG